jgi:hypothetical protein
MPARAVILTVTLATCGVGVAGCAAGDEDAAAAATTRRASTTTTAASPPSTQMTTLTGTLRGNMAAIGGETTGWVLVGDGATGRIDLDVSRVQDRAKQLDGKRVSVSGRMVDKEYVERGRVRVMKVESIEAAK